MQLSLDQNKGHYYITACSAGEITIQEQIYGKSLIVAPTELIEPWGPQTVDSIQLADLSVINGLNPDIVILGAGSVQVFPRTDIMTFFYERNIGFEVMTTRAACRTFNVLVSEGRKVVAALIME